MPQQELSQIIQDIDSRIRSLEAKNTLLRERVENINQNSLNQNKKYIFELKKTKTEITSIKKFLNQITKELKLFAKKEQIKTLEKYIDLLNLKEFITKKELDEILKNKK